MEPTLKNYRKLSTRALEQRVLPTLTVLKPGELPGKFSRYAYVYQCRDRELLEAIKDPERNDFDLGAYLEVGSFFDSYREALLHAASWIDEGLIPFDNPWKHTIEAMLA